MKKLIFSLALLTQTAFAFANEEKTDDQKADNSMAVTVRYENAKMYRQPGTSTETLKALHSTDDIKFVRKYNQSWSIVMVNGQVGYVLTAELGMAKPNSRITIAKN